MEGFTYRREAVFMYFYGPFKIRYEKLHAITLVVASCSVFDFNKVPFV